MKTYGAKIRSGKTSATPTRSMEIRYCSIGVNLPLISNSKRIAEKEKKSGQRPLSLLSYQDSNLDKQNQNLLCYHYTIRQSIFVKGNIRICSRPCKDTKNPLICYKKPVVLLASLQNNVPSVNQVIGSDDTRMVISFFLIH